MTPAEKKASELAEQHINDPSRTGQKYNENDLKRISDFKAGFRAAIELEEVKGLSEALQITENVFSKDDRFIGVVSGALTAWRSFRGEK